MGFLKRSTWALTAVLIGLSLSSCATVPPVTTTDRDILQLKEAIRQNPNDPQRVAALGFLYLQKYKQGEGKDPSLLEGVVNQGREAIRLKPDLASARLLVGEGLSLKALKNPNEKVLDEAMTHIREAFKLDPGLTTLMVAHPSHLFVAKGYLLLAESKKDPEFVNRAVEVVKEGIRVMPDSAESHKLLGIIYQHQGKTELALLELQEAARLNPDDPGPHYLLGAIYKGKVHADKNKWADERAIEQGIKQFKEILRLKPEDTVARRDLAWLYRHKGLYELEVFEAREALSRVNSVGNYKALADAYLFRGDYDKAVSKYNEVFSLKPNDTRSQLHLAFTYFLEKRYDDSIREYKKYFGLLSAPSSYAVLHQYLSMKEVGQDAEAQELLEDYAHVFLRKEWQLYLLRYHQGELTESELISRARHRGQQCEAHFYIAYQYLLKGNEEGAKKYLQKAMDTKAFAYVEYIGARARLEHFGAK